jgi:hypothetical protein
MAALAQILASFRPWPILTSHCKGTTKLNEILSGTTFAEMRFVSEVRLYPKMIWERKLRQERTKQPQTIYMAVHLFTKNPQHLLDSFKKAIDDGHVKTWAHKDGFYTHTPPQWNHEAWFRPAVKADRLVMNIVKPQNKNVSTVVYAVYHGRMIESMLEHCNKLFSSGAATALPEAEDKVS